MLTLTAACTERNIAQDKIKNIRAEADQALTEIKDIKRTIPPLVIDEKPWFGQSAVRFRNGEPLPSHLVNDEAIVLTFEKPLTFQEVGARIQATTGIRVIVDSSYLSGTQDAEEVMFLPVDGREVPGGRILWQGSLTNLLNQVSDRFDAQWDYTNQTIRLSRHVVRTFMLHALAGDLELTGSISSGSGSEGNSGLPEQSIDTTTNISIWEEIKETLTGMVEGRGTVTLSPGTGTITVAATPSAVHDVEKYLHLQNSLRLRRVAVDVRVLSVSFSRGNDFNFNLEGVIDDALNGQPFIFSSNRADSSSRELSAGIVTSIPAGMEAGSIDAVVSGLSAIADDISTLHSGTLITMSDQPAPLQVATKRAYVKSVKGSATEGATSTSIEPDVIDIGLSMNILPRVITQDKVMLRLALGITDLVELRDFTSAGASVQLPEIESTGFLQNTILSSGETLVLAGFERKNANDTQIGTGVPWNIAMGGQINYEHKREIRVLLIKAEILPEQEFDIIGNE